MPYLDGLGVLAPLREAGLDIPVIVQTAHGGIDNVVSAMRAGAADFVVKPANPERLQVCLRNALAMVNRPMVHLTYQTAFVDDSRLALRDDIYGFDALIHAILNSDERRIADLPRRRTPSATSPPQSLTRKCARPTIRARSSSDYSASAGALMG